MRAISRPPTARCTLATYVSFILSNPHSPTCCHLGEVLNISHDSVNRFLRREDYTPHDLFNEVRTDLRGFGTVKVFRTWLKNQPRHYALYQPKEEVWAAFDRATFLKLHDQHWHIEHYHRTLKQLCHIEHCQVRQPTAIRNHVFAAICGYVQLQRLRANDLIRNCYRLKRELFNEIIAAFIQTFTPNLEHLNPQFQPPVNA